MKSDAVYTSAGEGSVVTLGVVGLELYWRRRLCPALTMLNADRITNF